MTRQEWAVAHMEQEFVISVDFECLRKGLRAIVIGFAADGSKAYEGYTIAVGIGDRAIGADKCIVRDLSEIVDPSGVATSGKYVGMYCYLVPTYVLCPIDQYVDRPAGDDRYPHVCDACKGPAYVSITQVDCKRGCYGRYMT